VIRDEQPGSYFRELRNKIGLKYVLEFFEADPGKKKFGSGIGKIRILDPQHSLVDPDPTPFVKQYC
jgi:hypothetical protein